MKYKVTALAAMALMIYSCASKSSVSTAEVKKTEPAPVAEVEKPAPAAPTAPTAPVAPTVMTPELAEGKTLYDNNCAKCHRLYEAKEFSAEEWKPIMKRMQKKAHLDDLQGQKMLNYITMK